MGLLVVPWEQLDLTGQCASEERWARAPDQLRLHDSLPGNVRCVVSISRPVDFEHSSAHSLQSVVVHPDCTKVWGRPGRLVGKMKEERTGLRAIDGVVKLHPANHGPGCRACSVHTRPLTLRAEATSCRW